MGGKKMRYLAAAIVFSLSTTPLAFADVRTLLQAEFDAGMQVVSKGIVSESFVEHVYAENGYELMWASYGHVPRLLDTLADSKYEGLNPVDYHVPTLRLLHNDIQLGMASARQVQQFDVLLTDAVLTYAKHLLRGKVDPKTLSNDWDYNRREIERATATVALDKHIKAGTVSRGLRNLRTEFDNYKALKKALREFLALAERGEFVPVNVEPNQLRAGTRHAAVGQLAQRLVDVGDLSASDIPEGDLFSSAIFDAVVQYQKRHQLAATGIINKQTLEQINTPYKQRVNQIRANLERARWIEKQQAPELIIVNVPGYKLYYYKDGKEIWRTPVVVGADQSRTPIFTRQLRYLEFNPTWTVPRSKIPSIIEATQKDYRYFSDRRFYLVDNKGKRVEGDQVDWSKLSKNYFPYWIVQEPWENNSLGQVKFMFPNEHAVYLHDTPAKGLFKIEERAFSYGCIRVDQPMKLAEVILGSQGYNQSKISDVLANAKPTRVNVDRQIQVLLMYWTALHIDGENYFYPDIYGRDQPLIDALLAPIQ